MASKKPSKKQAAKKQAPKKPAKKQVAKKQAVKKTAAKKQAAKKPTKKSATPAKKKSAKAKPELKVNARYMSSSADLSKTINDSVFAVASAASKEAKSQVIRVEDVVKKSLRERMLSWFKL